MLLPTDLVNIIIEFSKYPRLSNRLMLDIKKKVAYYYIHEIDIRTGRVLLYERDDPIFSIEHKYIALKKILHIELISSVLLSKKFRNWIISSNDLFDLYLDIHVTSHSEEIIGHDIHGSDITFGGIEFYTKFY